MDGYTLLAQVRTRESQADRFTPAIALTAYASEDDKARAIAAGFQAHVAKPFNVTTLVEAVASIAPAPV